MGVFNFFKPEKPKLINIMVVIVKLDKELLSLREQFLFGILSAIKSEGGNVESISPLLVNGSEIDSALKGFQLTSILGFSQKYLDTKDWFEFERLLYGKIAVNDKDKTHFYNEKYLDCQGDIECLSNNLAYDIHKLWKKPQPDISFIAAINHASKTLSILSQAVTSFLFGDYKTEKKLKKLIKYS